MLKSIRILLAIAAHYDYEIWEMDVKIAFLDGSLTEKVYMIQPEGFISGSGNKVCKLHKSIYGLKLTSRSWNIRFKVEIKGFDFFTKMRIRLVCNRRIEECSPIPNVICG